MKFNLRNLDRKTLTDDFFAMVRTERKVTAEVIEYIREIDRRQLYLDFGVTSMFAFLTEKSGYSPSAAQRRIVAARLSNEIPEIHESLKSGELNLSHVSLLAQGFRQKEKESQVRLNPVQKRQLIEKIKFQPIEKSEVIVAQELDLKLKAHDFMRRQKDESIRAEMTFTKAERVEIERAKDILSHQLLNPKISELFLFLVRDLLKRKDPLQNKTALSKVRVEKQNCPSANIGASSRGVTSEMEVEVGSGNVTSDTGLKATSGTEVKVALKVPSESVHTKRQGKRYIRVRDTKALHERDGYCQWKDPNTGKICGSTFQLQKDHIKSKWAGGTNDLENLQLLCGVHNRLKYQRETQAEFLSDQRIGYIRKRAG